jgi:tRNA (guanine-N7-)-methyltransferase
MLKHYSSFFKDIPQSVCRKVNPYLGLLEQAREQINTPCAYYGTSLSTLKGSWKKLLPRPDSKLIIEIGCHNGNLLRQLASDNPQNLYVGIDITYKRVYVSARKAYEKGLTNVVTLLADARCLPLLFARGEIDDIIIFFPDPWKKKNYTKQHRLIDQTFCLTLAELLTEKSNFYLRTDCDLYFFAAQHYLNFAGFNEKMFCSDLADHKSHYHQLFLQKGMKINEGSWSLG